MLGPYLGVGPPPKDAGGCRRACFRSPIPLRGAVDHGTKPRARVRFMDGWSAVLGWDRERQGAQEHGNRYLIRLKDGCVRQRSRHGDDPGPLLVVCLGDRLPDVDHAHRNGRTSTLRLQCFEPSVASLSATSRSGASMIQKPARYSFDSRKGLSVSTGSSRRLSMTVAVLGDPRPPAKTQWPSALSRSSLNALMAAISVGVAKSGLSWITETRYCISDHLLW